MKEQRININEKIIREVVEDLRERGYTNESISKEIDSRIDSVLYNEYCMSVKAFNKLEKLYGESINHESKYIRSGKHYQGKPINKIEKSLDLSELFGIILGDGHLQEYRNNRKKIVGNYFVEITLHDEEIELIRKTNLMISRLTSLKPKIYKKQGNCVKIVVQSKQLLEKFKELGLETGNKKDNQVGVPPWIKKNGAYSKHCLRGLIDTDGSIYPDKRNNKSYKRVQFSNRSKNLLDDFEEMCQKLGIKVVKGGPHQVQISRKSVEDFLEIIEPIKNQKLPDPS